MKCLPLCSIPGESNVLFLPFHSGDLLFGGLTKINWERVSSVSQGVVTVLHLICELDLGEVRLPWLMGRRISNLNSEYMMEQISLIELMDHLLLLLLLSKDLLLSGLKVNQSHQNQLMI